MLIYIIEKVSSNVFTIYVNINGQWTSGSGILLDEKGTIFTCEHVVSSNQSNTEIYVRKEGGIPVKATLITTDKIRDLAIIKIDKSKIDYPIKFAKYGYIRIGQDCFVLGYPLGLSTLTLTKAVKSAKGETLLSNFPFEMLQIDSRINSGNSGDPLFTNEGEVIGIISMKYVPFFEQINELHTYINNIPIISGDILLPGINFSITKYITVVNEGIKRILIALNTIKVGIGWVMPIHFK